jgi:hypothetical protein
VAEQKSDFITGLVAGAIVGGVIGGVLGTVLSQRSFHENGSLSRRARQRFKGGDGQREVRRLKAGRRSQDLLEAVQQDADRAIAEARQSLENKIEQLNAAIEETRSRLVSDSPTPDPAPERNNQLLS